MRQGAVVGGAYLTALREFMSHWVLEEIRLCLFACCVKGYRHQVFLEAAVKVETTDYLVRYGDILSGNYTI